jgi:hypothetical protein
VRLAALVLLAGCGRVAFDGVIDAARTTTDAPKNDGPNPDAPAVCGGLYCDDFETPSLNARWMLDTGGGEIGLDTMHAHSGTQAVRAHVDAVTSSITNPRATLITFDQLPITGTLYLRMWVYKAGSRPVGFFDQTINFADAPGNGISTGAKDGMMANNDYTPPTVYQQSASATEPLDGWHCWIFEMPSGTTGTSRVFLDSTEIPDVKIDVTSAQPQPDHVYVGTEWVGTIVSQPQSYTWIDDVELATSMPSC